MRLAYFCFVVATLAALVGMSVGIHMGINHDFTLAPAHAHLNLLGWVTMALYGLYYRSAPVRYMPLAWVQAVAAALGFPAMSAGLAAYLSTGSDAFAPLIIGGSLLTIGAMAMFLAVLVLHAAGSMGPIGRQANVAAQLAFQAR